MTLADVCLFAAVLLYLLPVGVAKRGGGYDNANPRASEGQRTGWRARAYGAHQNGLETFAFFAVAVMMAEFRQAPQMLIDELAGAFIALRLLYIAVYVGNRPTLRTVIWGLGLLINIALFFSPLFAAAD